MKVVKTSSSGDEVVFDVIATQPEIQSMKSHVLTHFQQRVKVPGFRSGNVPAQVLERNIDPQQLQTEFLQEAIEQMYYKAVDELKLRPLEQPKVTIKKFVPYEALEFEAKVSVIGEIKLADYKTIKKKMPKVVVTKHDVDKVIESLRARVAEKKEVTRASKLGDQVWIDFAGYDSKGQPVQGADGKDYPLSLGSNTFIPGFEDNLVGLKQGAQKEFTLKFPKDYQVSALAAKSVVFKVTVKKVEEVVLPPVDDSFAKKIGPFSSLHELKKDIEKQLLVEKQREARQQYESELIKGISDASKLVVPQVMLDEQLDRMLIELKQNLAYRGQTYDEFLKTEAKSDEQYRKEILAPRASERVKASLVLSEIAEAEKITVTPEELETRITQLKSQYQDVTMQAELNKQDARRDVAARLLTEKTVQRVVDYASK